MEKEKKKLEGRILLYSYSDKHLPNLIKDNNRKFYVFSKNPLKLKKRNYSQKVRKFQSNLDFNINKADTIFLDNNAVKALVAGYPSTIPNIFIALDKPKFWFWIVVGLIRRIFHKQIKIIKIEKLIHGKSIRFWLKIKNRNLYSGTTISKKIGIRGLIKFLNKNNINYVLLRSFENLLSNENKDYDFLLSDKNYDFVKSFLDKHPGNIAIDLWTVSKPSFNGMTYYIPNLARKILDNSVKGQLNANVPNKKYHLLSLIYHCLYHKGVNAGIPSAYEDIETIKFRKNKNLLTIKKLAKDLKINLGNTMEELEQYLVNQGWQPGIDTLNKIACYNEWVKKRFSNKSNCFFPFTILIFRQYALGNLTSIKDLIFQNNYKIIISSKLKSKTKKQVINNLRGGNWNDHKFMEESKKYNPCYAMIVYKTNISSSDEVVDLKYKIRKKFDKNEEPSVVHSTDNESEFWDYLQYCFPKKKNNIKNRIENLLNKNISLTLFEILDIWLYKLKISTKQIIKNFINKLVKIN